MGSYLKEKESVGGNIEINYEKAGLIWGKK